MLDRLRFILRYFRHSFRATDEHGIHSPFVFDLYNKIIRPKKTFYVFDEIEKLRNELLQSEEKISVTDLGAGSKVNNYSERKIKDIVKNAGKSTVIAQTLFKLAVHFKPSIIFDLGTSVGLTTLYLASAEKNSKLYTFEGCHETSKLALENFKKIKTKNIQLTEGNLDQTLERKICEVEKIDFAFFDANHRYEPTMRYFNQCMLKSHLESIFIFDDIHWSEEMEKAWEEIKADPNVMISIDLFYIGIVFFRTNQPKQHFILKF